MATAVGTVLAGLGGSLLGAFSNQSRQISPAPRHQDTSTAGIALAKDRNTAREARKNAQAERLLGLLTDPHVMGLMTVFGGLYAANRIPFSDDPLTNNRIQGVAAASAVLMGLGRAGVGDMTTLVFAGGAGAATALEGTNPFTALLGMTPAGQLIKATSGEIPGTGGVPWYAVTPVGGLVYALRRWVFD